MSIPQTDAEKKAWLTQYFGEIATTSYTEANETAYCKDELFISDGEIRKTVRGYGNDVFNPISNLFDAAMKIKTDEHFETASGKKFMFNRETFSIEPRALVST